MFDINTLKVYPIKNIDLHDKLTRNHMRFINNHIIEWMKHRLKDDKYNTNEKKLLQNNLNILKNYDIDILKKQQSQHSTNLVQNMVLILIYV